MDYKLSVVAIDDSPDDLALIRRAMGGIEGWDIELKTFSEPGPAKEFLADQRVDAMLLDYQMGPYDGVSVLEDLHRDYPALPVILVTGYDSGEVATRAVRAGASDFLCKSRLSSDSLARALDNALEKARLKTELDASSLDLERRNAELEARNGEIRRFYHHVSHELKTPLTSAREFVSIVLDGLAGDISPQQRDYLEISKQSCDEMVGHINDLLDVSRIELGKLSLRRSEKDLAEIARAVVRALAPSADSAELSLSVETGNQPYVAAVDVNRMRQVMSNLITNAVKFTDPGGEIVIRVGDDPDGEFWVVSVTDNGQGIASENHKQIFERLFQVADADGFVGGMGIGLNLCREVVHLHGGEIWVESALGMGSSFSFSIPRTAVQKRRSDSSPEVEPSPAGQSEEFSSRTMTLD